MVLIYHILPCLVRLIYYNNDMKIFEFYFNPKKRRDRFFSVHSYEPRGIKEKAKGSLYIVGELNNALEVNARFLKRLAQTVETEYYNSSLKTASSALKEALKKANIFLTQESKNGNVDWLGSLHVAILLFITIKEKKTMFHLTKTGSIKVSLVRQGMTMDVGKNLEKFSSQLGTVFENLVSGTLMPGDSVTVITKEIFEIFSKEKSLEGVGMLKDAKQFHEFLSRRKRLLSLASGILVSFVIEEEEAKRSRIDKSLLPRLPLLLLPLGLKKQLFSPKPSLMLKKRIKLIIKKPKLEFTQISLPAAFKKPAILVLLFLLLLLLGALVFG